MAMPVMDMSTREQQRQSLVEALLHEQQQTTAVGRFVQSHDGDALPANARYYRDLIPFASPVEGEQYAFEVDLDACSGCKACVTACNNLNGLEEGELWRSVGLLHGGTSQLPVIQHVTTACHHCLEPACLDGCPVHAYEKDPLTGIVRHLDDQCIGCQYCILKCPYDVPQYSHQRGIVRKCDMCRHRLAEGEAPACVQACPNRAIRIAIVNQLAIAEESEANLFLPGAPEPGYTLPTTIYKTRRALPRNLLPADYYSATPQHAHLPLVFMLVLTQMSVGAFLTDQVLSWQPEPTGANLSPAPWSVQPAAAFGLGLVGLGAAVLHLGRPLYAFRAVIGLRTSWLSREILAFGVFALLASIYASLPWLSHFGIRARESSRYLLGSGVAAAGLTGVFCSVMIYASTRRPFWNTTFTGVKFFLTCAVLGVPTALAISLASAAWSPTLTIEQAMGSHGAVLCRWLVAASLAKLLFECLIFASLRSARHTPLKRTALLMTGELGLITLKRFFLGAVGGVLLPGLLLVTHASDRSAAFSPLFVGLAVALIVVVSLAGELMERYLFFTAVVAPKMPGAPAS